MFLFYWKRTKTGSNFLSQKKKALMWKELHNYISINYRLQSLNVKKKIIISILSNLAKTKFLIHEIGHPHKMLYLQYSSFDAH